MKLANLQKKQIDLIRESMCVYTKCMECKDLYKAGKLCFATIEDFVDDRGKSCLFKLKEMCHELFRNSDEASYKEKLYDITVGYIFHEAMKLRENLYQLEYYTPGYNGAAQELTSQEKKIVHEIESLVKKAEKRMKEGFKEIKILLRELVGQMKDLIKLYQGNYLLPRFIFENEKSIIRIYGRKGFADLIGELYKDGRTRLMMRAAESYLTSEYYEHSRSLMHRVVALDKNNDVALFLYQYASAFYFYYRNMLSKALRCARNAASMKLDAETTQTYGGPLKRLIVDLSKEVNKVRKT